MNFQEAIKKLDIEEYGERIFIHPTAEGGG